MRVPVPDGKVKEIKNLVDDRVFLMRLPERLGTTGFVLILTTGQSVLMFHIHSSNQRQTLVAEEVGCHNLDSYIQAKDLVSNAILVGIENLGTNKFSYRTELSFMTMG